MSQAKAPAAAEKRGSRDVPERIGKYVIINEVGQGSTGRVFLSHDPYYGRDVAIKLYNIESEEDEQKARVTRKMFFNEAQMMGRLQHPNILPIYDAGEENGAYYVVTEHVHGARTLNAYCRPDNLLRIDDVVEILFKCAKGLHYAHGRGVVHRDIKPSNIMLTLDNDVRIIDFGIALIKDSDVSRIEGIAGSPSYMSPEQVQSAEITHKLRHLLARRRHVRAAHGLSAVPREQLEQAAAPDRVRDAAADSHAARRHSRGDRERRDDGAAQGARASGSRARSSSPAR